VPFQASHLERQFPVAHLGKPSSPFANSITLSISSPSIKKPLRLLKHSIGVECGGEEI